MSNTDFTTRLEQMSNTDFTTKLNRSATQTSPQNYADEQHSLHHKAKQKNNTDFTTKLNR
jgi:hypothetical protein